MFVSVQKIHLPVFGTNLQGFWLIWIPDLQVITKVFYFYFFVGEGGWGGGGSVGWTVYVIQSKPFMKLELVSRFVCIIFKTVP